jgi:hypothetical protein
MEFEVLMTRKIPAVFFWVMVVCDVTGDYQRLRAKPATMFMNTCETAGVVIQTTVRPLTTYNLHAAYKVRSSLFQSA